MNYRTLKVKIEYRYIIKNENKEYEITKTGKSEYEKMIKMYNLKKIVRLI